MKKECRMSKSIGRQWWKIWIFLLLISFVSVGCGDDGNGSPTAPMAASIMPTPGAWAGQDISFTVGDDSASISNFLVVYSGHANGSWCSFNYKVTFRLPSSFSITNNTFTLSSSTQTITGTFTGPNTATVDVSWSKYHSGCDATMSGSRTYMITHQ